MDTYIDSYGYLNGNKIKDDWFSTNSNKFNIFLSHSHKNFDLAVGLAGWLHKEFGLNVFIDSCVWEYSGDLKNKLIKEYCKSSSDTCDPEESLRIAAHVDLMLASAITQMIDETECIFFLNTSQSLNGSYLANGYNINQTTSPWINYELFLTSQLPYRIPNRYKNKYIYSVFAVQKGAVMPL